MNPLFITALFSFFISAAIMPLFVRLSILLGAISEVGGRHVGEVPIGRLGGLAVLFGVGGGIAWQIYFNPIGRASLEDHSQELFGLMIGLILVGGVGFWDDIKRLSAKIKLIVQLLAAVILCNKGALISVVDLPVVGTLELSWLSYPVTVIWIVGVVNAVNLIDGLDGLAGGVILFAAIANFVAAVGSGSMLSAILMSSVGGAVFGFLIHNWHPAKIYLGDGGAYSLGLIIAVSSLLAPVQKASTGISLMVPVLAVGLPIFDTLFTMVRRLLSGRGVFSPDKGHLHHLLLDTGMSQRRVVIGLYSVCCIFCSIALALVLHKNKHVGIILVVVSFVGAMIWGVKVRRQLMTGVLKLVRSRLGNGSK